MYAILMDFEANVFEVDDLDDAAFPESAKIVRNIEAIVSFGLRRPGYPGDEKTESWLLDRFTDLGLDQCRAEPVNLHCWEPREARLTVRSESDEVLAFEGFPLPHTVPVEGLVAPLVLFDSEAHAAAALTDSGIQVEDLVDSGLAPDGLLEPPDPRNDQDLTGCIAVSELKLSELPQAFARQLATAVYDPDGDFDTLTQTLPFGGLFTAVAEPAMAAGASGYVGALTGMPWESNGYYVPYDGVERPMPGLWLSRRDGTRLLAEMRKAQCEGVLSVDSTRSRAVSHNIIGTLKGSSDEWIVVASHHDAPWASAVGTRLG